MCVVRFSKKTGLRDSEPDSQHFRQRSSQVTGDRESEFKFTSLCVFGGRHLELSANESTDILVKNDLRRGS